MTLASPRLLRKVSMVQGASSDAERKIVSILRVLSESSEPLGSITIARELERYGIFLSERAVRYHLRITDERGYTEPLGRDGRMITTQGLEELRMALAPDQIGFVLEKLEMLAFHTTFDPRERTGQVAINTSLFDEGSFRQALSLMQEVFKAGLCVSENVAIASEGEKLGDVVVPRGKVGLATLCSVTINGVLLKAGIPIESRFGGVLEVRSSRPRRFTAIINYAGTSLDPSEQYIRARMTSVGEVAKNGSGRILANFREIPAPCRRTADDIVTRLKEARLGGLLAMGNTSAPVFETSVGLNRIGLVVLGGMNPVAAAEEAGFRAENHAMCTLMEYGDLVEYGGI